MTTKRYQSIVPRAAHQVKSAADDTIYLTPSGLRVRLDPSVKPDPILGTKVRRVSDGKWVYLMPGKTLTPE